MTPITSSYWFQVPAWLLGFLFFGWAFYQLFVADKKGKTPAKATVGTTPKPPYFKEHPWRTVGWIVFSLWLLAVGHLAIWGLLVEVPKASINYTLQSIQKPAPTVQVAPQGKSVGGPLRWSENANVAIRKRFTTEKVEDDIAFVGMVPPASWIDVSISHYGSLQEPWNAFLIGLNGSFPSQESIHSHAVSQHRTKGTVFPLPELSGPKMKHSIGIKNETGNTAEDGFSVNELYVQFKNGSAKTLQMDRKEPAGTFQYEVKVGANTTSLTIPKNFNWLWFVAVHHPKYQASLDGQPVPAQGINIAGHQNLFGTMAKVNGETKVLETPLLFQAGEVTSSTIDLFLNVPKDAADKIGVLEPATVIVGVL